MEVTVSMGPFHKRWQATLCTHHLPSDQARPSPDAQHLKVDMTVSDFGLTVEVLHEGCFEDAND